MSFSLLSFNFKKVLEEPLKKSLFNGNDNCLAEKKLRIVDFFLAFCCHYFFNTSMLFYLCRKQFVGSQYLQVLYVVSF